MMKAGGVKSGRQSNLDIVRIIALCSVLLMHGVENVWRIHPADVASTPSLERVFIFITYTLGRLGVPLFLFLTGYLMLGKRYKKNEILSFYKTKVMRLLMIALIWVVIYYLQAILLRGWIIRVTDIVRQFTFTSDIIIAPHLWYMPVIIGIYLFIPFVSNALLSIDKRVLKVLVTIALFHFFLIPTMNVIIQARGSIGLVGRYELQYLGGMYGVMMVIGYLCRQYWTKINQKLSLAKLIIYCLGSIIISIIMHYWALYLKRYNYDMWYDSIFILLASVSLFIILLKIFNNQRDSIMLTKIAELTFGCYLVHYFFIYLIKLAVNKSMVGHFGLFGIMTIGPAIASLIIVHLASKSKQLAFIFGVK